MTFRFPNPEEWYIAIPRFPESPMNENHGGIGIPTYYSCLKILFRFEFHTFRFSALHKWLSITNGDAAMAIAHSNIKMIMYAAKTFMIMQLFVFT